MDNNSKKTTAQQNYIDQEDEMDQIDSGDDKNNQQGKQVKKRTGGVAMKKKQKKCNQINAYQQALSKLRSQAKTFCKPFQKYKLNISTMQAMKMLKEAIDKDKDIAEVLRNLGCKTRMRVRNKTGTKQLFQVMLKYLQDGTIPAWMEQQHKILLQKDDSKFQSYLRLDD